MIACDVVNPADMDVEFDSIGGLDGIKEALFELAILPLKRPELFAHGKLLRPVRGVLLYGPPGTGKTMLAKAIAKESGAVFINVRVSNLMSKWFGDAQKLVAAVFSLAYKLQPAIIFIDEVDSFLGQRSGTENEALTIMKTEFMALWDGFTTDREYQALCI
nr:ATPase family AAA domain-containing protein 1-like isoform X1 [Ipomoea batatas]